MRRGSAAVEVEHLTKTFGSVRAVDDLSFRVEPGAVTGFLGPNGAGKTTTLRMLLALIAPDEGAARIGGQPYGELAEPSHRVGAVLELGGFHPARTGRHHLRVTATVAGLPRDRVDEVLAMVGLTDASQRRVGGYSLGMRQRLALAGALLGDPDVLVLDEPANGLDPEGISWLRRLLREFAAEGRTLLVSSHVLSEVQQLVDRVVIIHRGRLVTQGPLPELSSTRTVTVGSPQPDRLGAALARAGIQADPAGEQGLLRATDADTGEISGIAYRAGIQLTWLATETSNLEDLFLSLTDGAPSHGRPPARQQDR